MLSNLIISLLLGAAIGLEREAHEKKVDKTARSGIGSLGVRSYSLVSLLGTIAGIAYQPYIALFITITSIFGLLLLAYYVIGSAVTKDNGLTTEYAILMCFVLGIILGIGFMPVQMIIALTVVLILIMSLKDEIKLFVAGVREHELDAFISYAIIALVILPFLPNVSYTLSNIPGVGSILGNSLRELNRIEILNPFSLWRVVALITGIEVLGYFLEKTIGQKGGWLLTSFAGGFISSTSTTQSLAIRSKKSKSINRLVASAVIANVSSFIQHFILIASLNAALLGRSLGYIIGLSLAGIGASIFFLTRKESKNSDAMTETKKNMEGDKIFSLMPALQFAVIFLIVKFMSKAALVLFGNNAFYLTSAISALVGIDAITLNIGEIAGSLISWQTAVIALMMANIVNLVAKVVYSFILGTRSFSMKFLASMLLTIAGGVVGLLISL